MLLVLWRRTPTPRRRTALLIGVGASVGLLLLQTSVETDREKIIGTIEQLANAVADADFDALARTIDEDYTEKSVCNTRERLLAETRRRLTAIAVDNPSVSEFEVEITGDSAIVSFLARCSVQGVGDLRDDVPSRWRVRLVRRDDRWKLAEVLRIEILSLTFEGACDLPR